MPRPIISVENLGKSYLVGHKYAKSERYIALRDVVGRNIKNFGRKAIDMARGNQIIQGDEVEEFWALKEVNFEVTQGEVVGIVGRNGAGKSTLLKVLSRITEPTQGRVILRGRVASLLEVGTGFHPELTGRENIFLNGAILGMTRDEIKSRFDEIVDFAGVEKFLDTPVKRYSSGMYVRLAFAVAAHLDPEILVVDEVLAVGDAEFQKKCLGKMRDVAEGGRTVLLVSHNMAVIRSLCERAVLLEAGLLIASGSGDEVVSQYLMSASSGEAPGQASLRSHSGRLSKMQTVINQVFLKNSKGEISGQFLQGSSIVLEIEYDGTGKCEELAGIGFNLNSISGMRVGGFNSYMASQPPHRIPLKGTASFHIRCPILAPGTYFVSVSLGAHQSKLVDKVEHAIAFIVEPQDIYETGYLLTPEDGVVALECTFQER